MLKIDHKEHIFHLSNQLISYVIQVIDNHFIVNRYFGKQIPFFAGSNSLDSNHHAFSVYTDDDQFCSTNLPLESSLMGSGDYRITSGQITDNQQKNIPYFKYQNFDTQNNIPEELPHLTNLENATFLNINMIDGLTKTELILHYVLLNNLPDIIRWTSIKNKGKSSIDIKRLASLQLDLHDPIGKIMTFNGSHANEFVPSFSKIMNGIQEVSSNSGASGPQHQPFVAIVDNNISLNNGRYYAANLIWSGNFSAKVEKDQYQHLRLMIGLNDCDFNWQLNSNEGFTTPQAVITYGKNGLNGIAINFQKLYDKYLISSRIQKPLIAINTWETSYFELNEQECKKLAKTAASVGANLFVIDDGWFENRNSEHGQLGDWKVDPNKFPDGLLLISNYVHRFGLKFGLWIEPEMITENSNLFRNHPDWVLMNPNREKERSRNQLVLDLSQKKVQNYLIKIISNLIIDNQIDYLKWDFNRHLVPLESQINSYKDTSYLYIKGLYHILSTLRKEFHNLIIENCSSGGGRLDPGMLFYTDETWISDLTDSVARLRILSNQLSLYPLKITSSHLSVSPNEQDGRILPLRTRLELTGLGNLGLELNLNSLSKNELRQIKEFIVKFKQQYLLRHNAYVYNLLPLRKRNGEAIALLMKYDNDFLLIYSYGLGSAVHQPIYLPLYYLNSHEVYSVNNKVISGAELNEAGLTLPPTKRDFEVKTVLIKQVNKNELTGRY